MICIYCSQDVAICGHKQESSKPKVLRGTIRSPYGELEPVFCLHCRKKAGYTTPGTPIIHICDDCAATHGGLPLPEVPAEEVLVEPSALTH